MVEVVSVVAVTSPGGVATVVGSTATGTGVVAVEAVVVVVVSAWAGPDEKATRPKMATAPTRAVGAAIRAAMDLRLMRAIT